MLIVRWFRLSEFSLNGGVVLVTPSCVLSATDKLSALKNFYVLPGLLTDGLGLDRPKMWN